MIANKKVPKYLNLRDSQPEFAFRALDGLTHTPLRHRPAPWVWSIAEIVNHHYLLLSSFYPLVRWMWKLNGWYGRWRRSRPYAVDTVDLYRDSKFPQWVGFLWTPCQNTRRPVRLKQMQPELRSIHANIHQVAQFKS